MQKTDKWSEQVSFYRFFNNERVTEEALTGCMEDHCLKHCAGLEEAVLTGDTSEINLERHRNRITDGEGLGPAGNGKDLGFFCHPTIVTDPENRAVIGATDLHIWAREERKESKAEKKKRHPERKPLEEKESFRWAERAVAARERLSGVPAVTVVQDREGDIYESYAILKEHGVNWVIRANYDRKIRVEEGSPCEERESVGVKEYLEKKEAEGSYGIEVNRKGEKKRTAELAVRFGKVYVERPEGKLKAERERYPEEVEMWVVQAKEEGNCGKKAINWTLYTSHKVENMEEALKIIKYYKSRWLIEDLFRTVKSEGVNFEASELENGKALRKLFVMSFMAAIQIPRLRQARDGNSGQKTGLVFDAEQAECMEELLPGLEGKTEKLKNPYAKDDLAWAAWIIGRLGGWKVYSTQRPPGVITLHEGWVRFHNIFTGWLVAKRCV